MSKAKNNALAFASNPPAQVKFVPASYMLIRAVRDRKEPAEERVHPESEQTALQMVPFDPWAKGDLVVYVHVTRPYSIDKAVKSIEYTTWNVGRRATTPAQERAKIDLGSHMVETKYGQIWRITYQHLSRAAQLVGQTFSSREELEAALAAPAARLAA
jgi:hypothetical protein